MSAPGSEPAQSRPLVILGRVTRAGMVVASLGLAVQALEFFGLRRWIPDRYANFFLPALYLFLVLDILRQSGVCFRLLPTEALRDKVSYVSVWLVMMTFTPCYLISETLQTGERAPIAFLPYFGPLFALQVSLKVILMVLDPPPDAKTIFLEHVDPEDWPTLAELDFIRDRDDSTMP